MPDSRVASAARAVSPASPARQFRYRVAFFITALVALGLVGTLPFSVKRVVADILGSATGRVIPITPRRSDPPERHHTKLHLAVTALDEVQLLATIRVSGHHVCPGCAWKNRLLLVSIT